MNTEHILFFRGTDWQKTLSPQELENSFGQFKAWFDSLQAQGKIKAAAPLEHEGKILSGPNGRTVVDGPFAESKEAVGGYFLLDVADMDEALAIAKQCPALNYGASVEVRPVAEVCPTFRQAQEAMAELAASA
jgi:hypothetical protein